MKRFCTHCERERDLRAFDLEAGIDTTCRDCVRALETLRVREARVASRAKLVTLKNERRALIASLVRLDAQKAEHPLPIATLVRPDARKVNRRSLIAALVRLDAQIAELEADRQPVVQGTVMFDTDTPDTLFDGDTPVD